MSLWKTFLFPFLIWKAGRFLDILKKIITFNQSYTTISSRFKRTTTTVSRLWWRSTTLTITIWLGVKIPRFLCGGWWWTMMTPVSIEWEDRLVWFCYLNTLNTYPDRDFVDRDDWYLKDRMKFWIFLCLTSFGVWVAVIRWFRNGYDDLFSVC